MDTAIEYVHGRSIVAKPSVSFPFVVFLRSFRTCIQCKSPSRIPPSKVLLFPFEKRLANLESLQGGDGGSKVPLFLPGTCASPISLGMATSQLSRLALGASRGPRLCAHGVWENTACLQNVIPCKEKVLNNIK